MGEERESVRSLASKIIAREDNRKDLDSHKRDLKSNILNVMLFSCILASVTMIVYHLLVSSRLISLLPHFVVLAVYSFLYFRHSRGCSFNRISLAAIVLYGFILTPPAWLQLTLSHPMIVVVICFMIIMTILLFDGKRQKRLLISMVIMFLGMFIYDVIGAYNSGIEAGRAFIGQGIGMLITVSMLVYCVWAFKVKYNEMNVELYKNSMIDPLTGAYNSRKMNDLVKEYISLHKQERVNFSLSMIDMDNFKTINDTFGHEAGDILLQKTVRVMEQNLRDGDILARYGGDEFVVLLPGCDKENAKEVIERLLTAAGKIEVGSKTGIISFSAGIADIKEVDKIGNDVFKIADERLYYSKNNGRNMVSASAAS